MSTALAVRDASEKGREEYKKLAAEHAEMAEARASAIAELKGAEAELDEAHGKDAKASAERRCTRLSKDVMAIETAMHAVRERANVLAKRHHYKMIAEPNPVGTGGMSTDTKIALAAIGAVAVVGTTVGLVYYFKKKKAASQGPAWKRMNYVPPKSNARLSIDENTIAGKLQALGLAVNTQGIRVWMSPLNLAADVWSPSDTLPSDWPKDDPSPKTEYHIQFRNASAVALDIATMLSAPTYVWILST